MSNKREQAIRKPDDTKYAVQISVNESKNNKTGTWEGSGVEDKVRRWEDPTYRRTDVIILKPAIRRECVESRKEK